MRERLAAIRHIPARRVGNVLLSASLLLGSEATTADMPVPVSKTEAHHFLDTAAKFHHSMQLANQFTVVFQNPETDSPYVAYTALPPAIDAAFSKGLNDTLVRSALHEGYVQTISVDQDTEENADYSPYDNGVRLHINLAQSGSSRIFHNPDIIPFVLDHEIVHSFNNEWWQELSYSHTSGESIQRRKKIARVAAACAAINKTSLETFIAADREATATAFDMISTPTKADPTDLISYLATRPNPHPEVFAKAATAIRANDDTVGDAPRHTDPECQSPQLLSIASMIGHYSFRFDELDERALNLAQLQMKLDQLAYTSFICLKEGPGLAEILHDMGAVTTGHPRDNPTEAASSLVTSLLSNPDHFQRCLDNLDSTKRQQVEEYAAALLDLMNDTHRQIIDAIKKNPLAASIVNRLLAIDR